MELWAEKEEKMKDEGEEKEEEDYEEAGGAAQVFLLFLFWHELELSYQEREIKPCW